MIWNAIVLDITPTATPVKTQVELELESRAARSIAEYRLVKDGAADYVALGYGTDSGNPQATKLIEYLVIDSAFSAAMTEKAKRK